jgi:hypothetical protein
MSESQNKPKGAPPGGWIRLSRDWKSNLFTFSSGSRFCCLTLSGTTGEPPTALRVELVSFYRIPEFLERTSCVVYLPILWLTFHCSLGYIHIMTAAQIKRLMKTLGLTQQALADRIGAHRVTVADWVRGASKPTGLYLRALEDLATKAKPKRKK